MILVDVRFPELEETVDFLVEEDALGYDVMDEIANIAAQNSNRLCSPKTRRFLLYCVETSRQIDLNRTMRENGIQSGNTLLFI